MAFFPFMADISGKRILIIGGGRSALQKIRAFRGFGAHITVVASDPLSAVLDIRDIELHRRPYEVQDLEKADLIIAAAGDRSVNREIASVPQSEIVFLQFSRLFFLYYSNFIILISPNYSIVSDFLRLNH